MNNAMNNTMSTAIERHARLVPGFDHRLARTRQRLVDAARAHAGRIVQASSLGAEDMVLTDLIVRAQLDVPVITLDTGRLHAETLALIGRLEARYGIRIERWQPRPEAVLEFVAREGADAMRRSVALRKACCSLRKLEPLARALAGRTAWITGLRREQSDARVEVPDEADDGQGRRKINPLADWSWGDLWHYIATFDVPYNPLHDRFYPSIGCEPCTRAVALGEPLRAGRWWWEDDDARECGLHSPGPAADAKAEARAGAVSTVPHPPAREALA
jgi:phosphoadenosine phosphosulfate reductase